MENQKEQKPSKKYGFCEAASFCNMGRSTFKSWIEENKVKYETIKTPKSDYKIFSEQDLIEFIDWRSSILSIHEIAEQYKLTTPLIRRSISSGHLPAKIYLRLYWCKKVDVEKWIQKREKGVLRTRENKKAAPQQSIEQVSKPSLEELIQKLTTVLEGLL